MMYQHSGIKIEKVIKEEKRIKKVILAAANIIKNEI